MSVADSSDASVEAWRQRAGDELGGEPIESLDRRTTGGYRLQPLYTAEDVDPWSPWRPTLRLPAICTILEASNPDGAGQQLGEDLANGAAGTWLRLDRAARLGADPTRPGQGDAAIPTGTPIHHGSDLAEVLIGFSEWRRSASEDSSLDLWLDAGANALPWAALWLAHCERAAIEPGGLRVHFGADPLAALASDGALPRDLMKLSSEMAVLARFSRRALPGSSVATVSTMPYHDAGAGLVQELGFLVATLIEYLRGFSDSGIDAGAAASVISVRLPIGTELFPEIAKLRAARYLWRAALVASGVDDPCEPRLHAVGSRRTLARREPELNLLRGTEQAFAAYCGGADAVSLWGYDRAFGASRSLGRRLARNTPLILALEGRLDRVEDPAAGSYYIESVTRDLARGGWALAQSIERAGGMRKALLAGRVAEMVASTRATRVAAYASGRASITGVTDYVREGTEERSTDAPGAKERRAAALERLEAHRGGWSAAEPGETTYSRDFVVEELVARARKGATLVELGGDLGGPAGSERIEPLEPMRDAAPFEAGDSPARERAAE